METLTWKTRLAAAEDDFQASERRKFGLVGNDAADDAAAEEDNGAAAGKQRRRVPNHHHHHHRLRKENNADECAYVFGVYQSSLQDVD